MWKKHTQPPPEIRLSKSSEFLKTEYFRWRFVCVIPTGKRMKEKVFCICEVYSSKLSHRCAGHLYNLYLS